MRLIALSLVFLLAALAGAPARAETVDLHLVLAADVSRSVDDDEFRLQHVDALHGLAEDLRPVAPGAVGDDRELELLRVGIHIQARPRILLFGGGPNALGLADLCFVGHLRPRQRDRPADDDTHADQQENAIHESTRFGNGTAMGESYQNGAVRGVKKP